MHAERRLLLGFHLGEQFVAALVHFQVVILLARVEFNVFFQIGHYFALDYFTVLLARLPIFIVEQWHDHFVMNGLRCLGCGLFETDIFVNN